MDTVNYKCPNCSAGLAFDSKSQKMKCEYCGNTYSLEELEQLAEQQDTVKEDTTTHWEGFEPEQWQSDEKSNMAVWSCPSCGAEVLAEKTTGATICPYCDNPMIMPEQFADTYRPDYVIPFKKSKKEAPTVIVSACKILYSFFSGKIIPVFICSIVQTCKLFYCKIFQWIFFIYHNSYSIFSNDFCFQKLCFIIL